MTKREIAIEFCQLMDQVNDKIFKYQHTADCFCTEELFPNPDYQNDGMCFDFIKHAVNEKIVKEKSLRG